MLTYKTPGCIALLLILFPFFLYAQSTANKGWLFLSHKQKLSKKWDVLVDAQLRSADKFRSINTVLLRGASGYNFSKQHSAAFGYAYKGDWYMKTGK